MQNLEKMFCCSAFACTAFKHLIFKKHESVQVGMLFYHISCLYFCSVIINPNKYSIRNSCYNSFTNRLFSEHIHMQLIFYIKNIKKKFVNISWIFFAEFAELGVSSLHVQLESRGFVETLK